jgi:hypothetical protein
VRWRRRRSLAPRRHGRHVKRISLEILLRNVVSRAALSKSGLRLCPRMIDTASEVNLLTASQRL